MAANQQMLLGVTPAAGGSSALIRFASLTDMTETGNGTTGWIYTGDVTAGSAGGPDYSLASGVAGGMEVQADGDSDVCWPSIAFNTTSPSGDILADYHVLVYAFGGNWDARSAGFTDIVTNAKTYVTGDRVRISFNSTTGITVEIARAADPTTWLPFASTTATRSVTLYPRLASLNNAGAVLTAPRTVV